MILKEDREFQICNGWINFKTKKESKSKPIKCVSLSFLSNTNIDTGSLACGTGTHLILNHIFGSIIIKIKKMLPSLMAK